MLLLSILFFVLLGLNIKQKKKIVNYAAIAVVIAFIATLIVLNYEYTVYCVDFLLKSVLEYIYFPSTFAYFLIFVFITALMIKTLFSKKMSDVKRIINYVCFSILYFLFMSFIVLCVYSGVDIYDTVSLYKNDIILSIVQISNLLFFGWLLITLFYELYQFYKRKFD